jgi:subtilisin-like proprotein convertase family protein
VKLAEGTQKGLFQTFDVKLPAGSSKGLWKLRVVDGAARDVGTLEKWGLTLNRSECSAVSTTAAR